MRFRPASGEAFTKLTGVSAALWHQRALEPSDRCQNIRRRRDYFASARPAGWLCVRLLLHRLWPMLLFAGPKRPAPYCRNHWHTTPCHRAAGSRQNQRLRPLGGATQPCQPLRGRFDGGAVNRRMSPKQNSRALFRRHIAYAHLARLSAKSGLEDVRRAVELAWRPHAGSWAAAKKTVPTDQHRT